MNTEDERLTRLLAPCNETVIPDAGFTSRVMNALPKTQQPHPWRRSLLIFSSLLAGSLAACVLGGAELFEELTSLLLVASLQPLLPLVLFLGGILLALHHTWNLLRKAVR